MLSCGSDIVSINVHPFFSFVLQITTGVMDLIHGFEEFCLLFNISLKMTERSIVLIVRICENSVLLQNMCSVGRQFVLG
jgi:hypothetical protein